MEISALFKRVSRFVVCYRLGCFAFVACAIYFVVLAGQMNTVAGGSDSSGYFNHARLLRSGRVHVAMRTIPGVQAPALLPYFYAPLGLKPAPDGNGLVPTYPLGMPLFIAAASTIVGWKQACNVVLLFHAVMGVLLTYALCRAFTLSRPLAWIGAATLAGSPLYLYFSLQAMSDVPALAWTAAAIYAAWRSREGFRWGAAAGFAFSIAILIRPTDLLAILPVCIALANPQDGLIISLRRLSCFVAGATPGAIFFCYHSLAAYQSVLTTGYGDTSSLFDRGVVVQTVQQYAQWLPRLFGPLLWLGLALPFVQKSNWRKVAVLATWGLSFPGFYSAYHFTHEVWWYLRFLLPAIPALIVAALLVVSGMMQSSLHQRNYPARVVTAVFGALVIFGWASEVYWSRKLDVMNVGRDEGVYRESAEWLNEHVPKDGIVVSMQLSGAIFYYTDLAIVRWDATDDHAFADLVESAKKSNRGLYAALFPFEVSGVVEKRMPGKWTQIGAVRDITIWKREILP